MHDTNLQPASFVRRLAAMIYDAVLLSGMYFLLTAAAIALNGGTDVAAMWLRLLFVLASYLFFAWFWTHGGQTLGMRAWGLHLATLNGRTPGLRQASARFAAALLSWLALGTGFLWILFDRRRCAWHDLLSKTRIVRGPGRTR